MISLQDAEPAVSGGMIGGLVALVGTVLAVASLVLLPALLRNLPPDYFASEEPPPRASTSRHPDVLLVLAILRNALGALLLAAGIAMLVLPGQGILTILAALILVDFPGKRRLELGLVRRPAVFRSLNWIRRKTHRPPFLSPPPAEGPPG